MPTGRLVPTGCLVRAGLHLYAPSRPSIRGCGKIEGVSKVLEILTPEGLPPLNEKPGVSFIMPVLNEAEHIEQAITTILAQEYDGDKEIVLALGQIGRAHV